MRRINWDNFKSDHEILKYLKNLPRYKNSAAKSLFRRALFFLNVLFCRLFKISKPLFIVLVTNNKCNLNCTYCYGNYGKRNKDNDFSTKELLKIIDELKKLGTRLLTLHGGESLLRQDIGEIINYTKHQGFYISFNTNGYLVSHKIKQLCCVDTICLSLDGKEKSNDKNRGSGCFNKVMRAIDIVRQNNIPCVISATLTKDTMEDMEFLADLGLRKDVRIQYSILYNSGTLKEKCSEVTMTDREIRETVKEISHLKKAGFPIYYSDNVLATTINWPASHDIKKYFTVNDKEITKNYRLVHCYHGTLKYQIDADGRVITCWAHDYPDAPNIRELGVKEAIQKCRKNHICRHCAFLANNEHNALMHLSPRNICNIIRIQISDALKIKNKHTMQ